MDRQIHQTQIASLLDPLLSEDGNLATRIVLVSLNEFGTLHVLPPDPHE